MWEYTDKVRDFYRNPKNVGEIDNPDAVAEVGSISCGDALKLFLRINDEGIIMDAKFQTFGCGSAVASASALTEMIIGKHIDEASKITNQDIADYLGGLPEPKMHCSVMGREALEAAIANYNGIPYDQKDEHKVICHCFGVTEEKIRNAIKENKLSTVADITNYTKAGGGCGRCIGDIQAILDDEIKNREVKTEKKPLTKTQLIVKINNVLENHVSAELRKDGGDIELIDIEDNKVYVKLQGACKNCPSSNLTLKNFVENVLREHISPDIEVIES